MIGHVGSRPAANTELFLTSFASRTYGDFRDVVAA